VAWIPCRRAEAARRKGLAKSFHCVGTDRFSAVEGDGPTAQIESGPLFRRDLADTEVVGEVRSTTRGGLVARDCLEPAERTLQEVDRRHQRDWKAAVEGLEEATDQPHIMV